MAKKMHVDEVDIDTVLVKYLLVQQFPHWANLNLALIKPEGTDNVMYKLGNDKVVRLPRKPAAAANIPKETALLRKIASHLPIAIPALLGVGIPNKEYPFPWLVCSHLKGKPPTSKNPIDYTQAAVDLGNFVVAMQAIPSHDGPSCNRGKPLHARDEKVKESILLSAPFFDATLLTKLWNTALKVPRWAGNPIWIHGDLHPGNLLSIDRKITAVVDFGASGIGDPAVDLMVAWTLLTKDTRAIFRTIIQPDDATWERAYGWALAFGVIAYPYYVERNPPFAAFAKRALDEVLLDAS